MKKIFALLILTGLMVCDAGLVFLGTGCDEIKAPCEIEMIATEAGVLDLPYLDPQQPWRTENGYGILRFLWPKQTIFFVCTDKVVDYQVTFDKRDKSKVITVLPQARLIWKYAAPKPSKAVLMGTGALFNPLFQFNADFSMLKEYSINLAYTESVFGGYFIPGVEIKILTSGNQSDDFKFVTANILPYTLYKVYYKVTY
jgi:hypothetical protein